jgi:hypothetical protein
VKQSKSVLYLFLPVLLIISGCATFVDYTAPMVGKYDSAGVVVKDFILIDAVTVRAAEKHTISSQGKKTEQLYGALHGIAYPFKAKFKDFLRGDDRFLLRPEPAGVTAYNVERRESLADVFFNLYQNTFFAAKKIA